MCKLFALFFSHTLLAIDCAYYYWTADINADDVHSNICIFILTKQKMIHFKKLASNIN